MKKIAILVLVILFSITSIYSKTNHITNNGKKDFNWLGNVYKKSILYFIYNKKKLFKNKLLSLEEEMLSQGCGVNKIFGVDKFEKNFNYIDFIVKELKPTNVKINVYVTVSKRDILNDSICAIKCIRAKDNVISTLFRYLKESCVSPQCRAKCIQGNFYDYYYSYKKFVYDGPKEYNKIFIFDSKISFLDYNSKLDTPAKGIIFDTDSYKSKRDYDLALYVSSMYRSPLPDFTSNKVKLIYGEQQIQHIVSIDRNSREYERKNICGVEVEKDFYKILSMYSLNGGTKEKEKTYSISYLLRKLPDKFKLKYEDFENSFKGNIITTLSPSFSRINLEGPDGIKITENRITLVKEKLEFDKKDIIIGKSIPSITLKAYYKLPKKQSNNYIKNTIKGNFFKVSLNYPKFLTVKYSPPEISFKNNYMIVSTKINVKMKQSIEEYKKIASSFNNLTIEGLISVKNNYILSMDGNIKIYNRDLKDIYFNRMDVAKVNIKIPIDSIRIAVKDPDFFYPYPVSEPKGKEVKIYVTINGFEIEVSPNTNLDFQNKIFNSLEFKDCNIVKLSEKFYIYPVKRSKFLNKKVKPGKYKASVILRKEKLSKIFIIKNKAISSNIVELNVNKLNLYCFISGIDKSYKIFNKGPADLSNYSIQWEKFGVIQKGKFKKEGNLWLAELNVDITQGLIKAKIINSEKDVVSEIFPSSLMENKPIEMKYSASPNFVEGVENPLRVFVYNIPDEFKGNIACKWTVTNIPLYTKSKVNPKNKSKKEKVENYYFIPYTNSTGKMVKSEFYSSLVFKNKRDAWCGAILMIPENPEFVGKNFKINVQLVIRPKYYLNK